MKERKERKKFGIILFMVIIMIGTSFSFVFYGFNGPSGKERYKDYVFRNNGNLWLVNIDGNTAAFSFLPQETEDIPVQLLPELRSKLEIDTTYDMNNSFNASIALAQHQMGLTLANFNIFIRQGFTGKNGFNMPIIKCSDATSSVPVVYFAQSNETRIYLEGSCIIAEAQNDNEFIRIKDRLLYSILGVMNG